MADPLTSAIFATIVKNLSNEALKRYALFTGLNTELQKLSDSVDLIKGVLYDAEAKQWNSGSDGEAVKTWLRQLMDAAYDVDDVLDEFDIKSQRRQQQRGLKKHVTSYFSLHHNPIVFRVEMSRKLKNARERLDAIYVKRPRGLKVGSPPQGVPTWRLTTSLPESGICGRDDQKAKLINDLISSSDALSIHALCGIGGLGKTTLAKLVYNDAETIETHFDLRMWVCVSDDTDSRRLTRAIIESIGGDSSSNEQELDTLQRSLREKVNGKRFLLILDDVWDAFPVEWGRLKSAVESGAAGSVVLITTRIRQVAEKMYADSIRDIERLSEDDSWSLFALHAFRRREPEEFMETIGKCIVKKCGGVPLVLTVLGSSMHLKTEEKQWSDVIASELWHLADEGEKILATLKLSYTHLPMNLRQCFSYCCIYPKDYVMKKEELIQLWMANDFIISRGGCMGLHETGKEIFDELVARSFFQNVEIDYLGNTTCKLHDLLRDVAMSVMAHEIHSVQPGESLDGTKHYYRHVSVSYDEIEKYGIKGNSKIPSLRSFILLKSIWDRYDIEKVKWLSTQKYLRILRCDYQLLEKLSLSKHLRYLMIFDIFIDRLPESICSLYKLQTLELRDCCGLKQLPKGMKEMKSLVYLVIKGCVWLKGMPPGMGQLKGLRKLSKFVVGKRDGCKIGELKELNGLEGELSITCLLNVKSAAEAKSANLMGKKMLTKLELCAGTGNIGSLEVIDMEILSALQPHQNLKKLSISGCGSLNLPNWMIDIDVHLPHLVEIALAEFSQCQHLSIPLGRLNSLKVLELREMPCLQNIGIEVYGVGERAVFPSLEVLRLEHMSSLTEWAEIATSSGAAWPFLRLRELYINDCPLLTKFPIIPSLQELIIGNFTVAQLRVLIQANFIRLKSLSLCQCDELESFSELDSQHNNVCCLEKLHIKSCNMLQSLPSTGLWCSSSLRHLEIQYCREFISPSEDGLRHLTALQTLRVSNCPKMTSLPESIQHLTALQTLQISYCAGLSGLPDGIRSLTTLATLSIWGCPDLERRCEKEKGEDWPKIAHIPSIRINRKKHLSSVFIDACIRSMAL